MRYAICNPNVLRIVGFSKVSAIVNFLSSKFFRKLTFENFRQTLEAMGSGVTPDMKMAFQVYRCMYIILVHTVVRHKCGCQVWWPVNTNTYKHTSIHPYVHAYIQTYKTYINACMYVYVHTLSYTLYMCMVCTCMHNIDRGWCVLRLMACCHTHTYAHAAIHAYIHACMHAYIHTYIYT